MDNSDAFALQHSELNGFLFADIGLESGGMELSVLSALARQNVDPWQEAARLARLPWTVAVEDLAKLIAAMPASLWPLPVARVIATRLIGLLPGRHDGVAEGEDKAPGITARGSPRAIAASFKPAWLLLLLLGLAVLVGSAFVVWRTSADVPKTPPTVLAPKAPPPPPGND